MANKSKNAKKSRFGNPAKASADSAARSTQRPSAEARLDRAMVALSSGYVAWLEAESRPNKSIDLSLAILDDFFDMYRILEPHPDPTNLVPAALREVLEVTGHANPLGVMTLRNGVHDYIAYLAEAELWTGTHEDLMTIFEELAQTAVPGADPDDALDDDSLSVEDYEFAEIYLPTVSEEAAATTAANSPLWKNVLALLEWIGEGKDLTEHGTVLDQEGAAATLIHTGVGALAAAAAFTTPADHGAARLALYWQLLDVAGLVSVRESRISPTSTQLLQSNDPEMVLHMRDLMGHLIYTATLEGSEEGIYEDWHLEMADWLTQAASGAPPEAALLIQALEEPDSVHPDLLAIAQNIAHWAEEGLVTVGEFIEVPPVWRPDVFDMLKDDFPIQAVGPGAEDL
ncbi:hypothetical protein [Arthrobacter psychrochitiniphilus]|uniref:Uncharacterized protein n=1 Tax=Arthrobacter psychrochitiniphilus TaxID=291045 RepID=A0A2V3DTJ7_9MICC|nr:hypothetical protein [Arthrobacter psychrochitiniphilus]NYG15793.1 hypothetical protein [Arthrobacter psychrochitiniphilus]PXA66755.1 hypothetical protein CVS29_04065 [Arthrobacter psychrochitiniphilus]